MRRSALALLLLFIAPLYALAANLEIHAINVGWGESVLIKGPNGTSLLFDAGKSTKKDIVLNYLTAQHVTQLDYFVLSHNHDDHGGSAEYVVRAFKPKQSFYSGATENKTAQFMQNWFASYKEVAQPAPVAMPLGKVIDLGDGATATAIAANGHVMHEDLVLAELRKTNPSYVLPVLNDVNDSSIVLLIKYKGFDYMISGDLGGNLQNGQQDFETPVVTSILVSPEASVKTPLHGIDILHVGHHGSRTSTNMTYVDLAGPEFAFISVGPNQSFGLPNREAVDDVLIAKGVKVLQTDEGPRSDSRTTLSGYVVGHIKVSTDGYRYSITADPTAIDKVSQPSAPNEGPLAGIPLTDLLVDGSGTTPPPPPTDTAPTVSATVTGTAASITLNAVTNDDKGVTRADFLIDGKNVGSVNANSVKPVNTLSLAWNSTTVANGTHQLQITVVDTVAHSVTSSALSFTVNNPVTGTVFNEVEANDSISTANVPGSTITQVQGYFPSTSDNEDWYQLSIPANKTLGIAMTGPTASSQDYDLYLMSSSGTQLAASEGATTTEALSYKNTSTTTAKTVYIKVLRVSSYSRVTPYVLNLTR